MSDAPWKRKIILTIIIAAVLSTVMIPPFKSVVFENRFLGQVDRSAEGYVDAAFKRALETYALARGLNMIISVIQESTVDIKPLGFGVSAAVGQILDPVNDLVERFSWVMLVSLTSLGVQKLLIEISPWISVNLLLASALLLLLAGLWLDRLLRINLLAAGKKILFAALVLRFCVPLTAQLNEQIYLYFFDDQYKQASLEIERGQEGLQALDPLSQNARTEDWEERRGWWGKIREGFKTATSLKEWKTTLEKLKEKASEMLDHIIRLIIVYVLSSIILPIAFLWGLVQLFRVIAGGFRASRIEENIRGRIVSPSPDQARSRTLSKDIQP